MNYYDDTQTSVQKLRYNKLCSHFSKAAEIGAESIEKYNFLMKCVDEAIEKLMDWESHSNQAISPMLLEDHEQHQTTSLTTKFLTPLKVRSKGRPPSKRKKSTIEQIIVRSKKKKTQTKGNVQTQNYTQVEFCTQESVLNSNSLPHVPNMHVDSSTLQNIVTDTSSQVPERP